MSFCSIIAFPVFAIERTCWKYVQKRIECIKIDIYCCIYFLGHAQGQKIQHMLET
jgi:hypothetical protein